MRLPEAVVLIVFDHFVTSILSSSNPDRNFFQGRSASAPADHAVRAYPTRRFNTAPRLLRKSLPGFDCHKSLIGLISRKREEGGIPGMPSDFGQ
jgi:hypothetical protein